MLPILWVRKRRLRGTFPGHPAKKQVSKDSPSCLSPSPCSLGYRTSSLGGSLGRGGVEAHREPGEPGGLALECRKTTENHPPPQRYLHHAHPLLALCNSIKKQRNKLALLSILSGWGSRGRLGGSHISMQSASSCDGGEPVGAVGGGVLVWPGWACSDLPQTASAQCPEAFASAPTSFP